MENPGKHPTGCVEILNQDEVERGWFTCLVPFSAVKGLTLIRLNCQDAHDASTFQYLWQGPISTCYSFWYKGLVIFKFCSGFRPKDNIRPFRKIMAALQYVPKWSITWGESCPKISLVTIGLPIFSVPWSFYQLVRTDTSPTSSSFFVFGEGRRTLFNVTALTYIGSALR